MNTEITDTRNTAGRDWVCYDADCALCLRWVKRFRALLERYGFTLMPLQSAEVRAVLNLPEAELLAEMRVITRNGKYFGGGDAVAYISRIIFPPLAWLTRIPGAIPLLRCGYRFVASHRGCAVGVCRVDHRRRFGVGNPADWLPLLILVIAAAAVGPHLRPWLYMWLLAFALFVGCKWLCYSREIRRGTNADLSRKVGFLFGWIGMDAASFFAKKDPTQAPPATKFLWATTEILFGAGLIWIVTRYALKIDPMLAGWTGMVGLIFLLHFGSFHLLSLAWRVVGVNAPPLMRAPLLSRSLGEFWGERWNTAFNQLAARFLFRPMHRMVGVRTATLFVFLISGLLHDLVISLPARGGYGLPTLYFLIQGAGVLFEHTRIARRIGISRGLGGWLFTVAVTAGPVYFLFHPPFIRNVMLPFLNYIGAT